MEKEINLDMERLLRAKSWSQLNAEELREVKQFIGTEQDYESMRMLVLELRSSVQSDDSLVPSEGVRRNLLEAFENEQRKRRALWWNGLLISLKDKLRFDIPAVRYGVSGAFALLLLFVAFRFFTSGESQPDLIVKNEPTPIVNPSQNTDSSENEIQVAVNTDSSPIENKLPLIQEEELRIPVTQEPQSNSIAVTVDKSPTLDTTAAVANIVVDSSNIAALTVSPANAFLTSGSATALTTNPTATMNYTWASPTFTDAGSLNIVGTSVYNLGPEKTRPLASDAGLVRTYYSLR
jgi:hypothetical protein